MLYGMVLASLCAVDHTVCIWYGNLCVDARRMGTNVVSITDCTAGHCDCSFHGRFINIYYCTLSFDMMLASRHF
jgi:hypothetical protein